MASRQVHTVPEPKIIEIGWGVLIEIQICLKSSRVHCLRILRRVQQQRIDRLLTAVLQHLLLDEVLVAKAKLHSHVPEPTRSDEPEPVGRHCPDISSQYQTTRK